MKYSRGAKTRSREGRLNVKYTFWVIVSQHFGFATNWSRVEQCKLSTVQFGTYIELAVIMLSSALVLSTY